MDFKISCEINTSARAIYNAWLNSEEHAAMTGGDANISQNIGGEFSAWDEYISGVNLELIQNEYIKQRWRTVDFLDNQEDSILEIKLISINEHKTILELHHSQLLDADFHYKQGWVDNYFEPMQSYFEKKKK